MAQIVMAKRNMAQIARALYFRVDLYRPNGQLNRRWRKDKQSWHTQISSTGLPTTFISRERGLKRIRIWQM